MIEDHFQRMCRKIDLDGDDKITYAEVAKYFGQAHEKKIKTVYVASAEEAIALIRQKTAERVGSGGNGLQRAFKVHILPNSRHPARTHSHSLIAYCVFG